MPSTNKHPDLNYAISEIVAFQITSMMKLAPAFLERGPAEINVATNTVTLPSLHTEPLDSLADRLLDESRSAPIPDSPPALSSLGRCFALSWYLDQNDLNIENLLLNQSTSLYSLQGFNCCFSALRHPDTVDDEDVSTIFIPEEIIKHCILKIINSIAEIYKDPTSFRNLLNSSEKKALLLQGFKEQLETILAIPIDEQIALIQSVISDPVPDDAQLILASYMKFLRQNYEQVPRFIQRIASKQNADAAKAEEMAMTFCLQLQDMRGMNEVNPSQGTVIDLLNTAISDGLPLLPLISEHLNTLLETQTPYDSRLWNSVNSISQETNSFITKLSTETGIQLRATAEGVTLA